MSNSKPTWLSFLPKFLKEKIEHRPNFIKVVSNTNWLVADRIIRMGAGLFIGVWIARHLGPEGYGVLNYAVAIVSILTSLVSLGLDDILVRELVKHPEAQKQYLGTAFSMKFVSTLIFYPLALLFVYSLKSHDQTGFTVFAILAAGLFFQAFSVIDLYFQSQVISKFTVIANNLAFATSSTIKVVLLLNNAPVVYFAVALLVETLLTAFFLNLIYRFNGHSLLSWRPKFTLAKRLINDSWPLVISSIAIMIYMRIDQIMLGEMLGSEAVGIYSAAVKLSEAWYFVPMAIVGSVFPTIIQSKSKGEDVYYARLQKLITSLVWLAIGVGLVTTLLSEHIIQIIYGDKFSEASQVLAINIWTGVIVSYGVARGRWILAENLQHLYLYFSITGMVANIVFNLILIEQLGLKGAAISTLLSQFIANLIVPLCIKRTRHTVITFIRALLLKI